MKNCQTQNGLKYPSEQAAQHCTANTKNTYSLMVSHQTTGAVYQIFFPTKGCLSVSLPE